MRFVRGLCAWLARLAADLPFVAFALVALLVLNVGPEWLFWVGVVALIVVGVLTWKRQRYWLSLRQLRRTWDENGDLLGVANRDGVSPEIKDFEQHDWGRLILLQLGAGHSVDQIQKAVPHLLPVLGCDLIRVERLSPSTVHLRCITSTELGATDAEWQRNPLSIPDPTYAKPVLAEEEPPEWFTPGQGATPAGWLTAESGELK